MANKVTDPKERFWNKVNKNGQLILDTPCWEWTAGTFSNRYGQFFDGNSKIGAHRFSYKIHFGDISDELKVCHKCDNRRCVNPEHFFLGTQKENMEDMVRKGRRIHASKVGERNGRAIVTESNVLEMRNLHNNGISIAEIARRFDTSETQTARIVKLQSWRHV